MISVVIPTRNAAQSLAATLSALVPAAVDGIVSEVIIADSGSTDDTKMIADAAGANLLDAPPGRGIQMHTGAKAARRQWLLFLHADTVLEKDWHGAVAKLIEQIETGERLPTAATFRFTLNDAGLKPRLVEWGVQMRNWACAMPYGDQGLLVSRQLYDELGGFRPMPIFEDVDIVRRIGRRRLTMLPIKASTSADRFRQKGYARRVLRNWWCVSLYYLGTPADKLVKVYNA